MKLRSTTPSSSLSLAAKGALVSAAILMAAATPMTIASIVRADTYDDQINALRGEISGYESKANKLRRKADTLQNTLSQLSADKAVIQKQIDLYQKQHDQLVQKIADTKVRIEENKKAAGELVINDWMAAKKPLIVMVAGNDNLAKTIDAIANDAAAQQDIIRKNEEITELKKSLEKQQAEVKQLLNDQRIKREELAAKEATQQRILADTKGSEAAYQKMISNNKSQIKELERTQAELRRLRAQGAGGGKYITTGGSGGYPWAGVGYPCWNTSCVDPWQLYYRECVSYVAWKLSSQGYGVRSFAGQGHAYQWPGTTSGYTSQGYSPKKGAALVFPAGVQGAAWTGHVMFVEKVYGNGSILISEYNWDGYGSYSERELAPGEYSGGVFISFPRR